MILESTSNRWPAEARSEQDPWRREGARGQYHPICFNHGAALPACDLDADRATPTDNETIDGCAKAKINRLEIDVGHGDALSTPPA
jgi:hypothetical protein